MPPFDHGSRPAASKQILAVDLAEDFLEFVRILLQDECYAVTVGSSLPWMFEQLRTERPDLIVFDLSACEGNWDQFRRLEAETVAARVPMILTALDWEIVREAMAESRLGDHRWLKKPFDLEDLLTAVYDLIGPAQTTPREASLGDGQV